MSNQNADPHPAVDFEMKILIRRMLFALTFTLFCVSGSTLLGQTDAEGFDETKIKPFDACRAVEGTALFKPMDQIRTVLLGDDGKRLPQDCSNEFFTEVIPGETPRFGSLTPFNWQPTNFFHMPTYFDDVPLERYGQHRHEKLQPFVSGARFVLQLPVLPYKMGVDRPHACITTLGHQPPGDCIPCIQQRIPLEADAALLQAAATVGLVFLLP